VSFEELRAELEEEGIAPAVVQEATNKLLFSDQIREINGRLIPAGVELLESEGLRSHSFEVMQVLSGRAILLVDEKWRTVLAPEFYNGPRDLIKKGMKFKAAADFYRLDGKLHARIHAIETVLS
jgi:hypothetical protein